MGLPSHELKVGGVGDGPFPVGQTEGQETGGGVSRWLSSFGTLHCLGQSGKAAHDQHRDQIVRRGK